MQAVEIPQNSDGSHISMSMSLTALNMLVKLIMELLNIQDSERNLVYNCALHSQKPWHIKVYVCTYAGQIYTYKYVHALHTCKQVV